MLSQNAMLKGLLSTYIGRPATCIYNGKRRLGHIDKVKQGPALERPGMTGSDRFEFLDMPDGEFYVDWYEYRTQERRCFKWARVTDYAFYNGKIPDREDPKPDKPVLNLDQPLIIKRSIRITGV